MRSTLRATLLIPVVGILSCKSSTEKPSENNPPPEAANTATPEPASTAKAESAKDLSFGQNVVRKLRTGSCTELWQLFSDKMRSALGSEESFSASCKALSGMLANATVESESVEPSANANTYVAHLQAGAAGKLRVTLTYNKTGKIDGLLVRPDEQAKPAPSKYDDYQTKTALRLPFTTEWTVFWGGRTLEENYHVAHANQHFAYDILVTKSGATHKGQGTQNSDYYCFGQPIVAAGAGKVIEAITGVEDNVPGQMNAKQVTGNHVIVDHGNGEYALYAHLKLGSTAVSVGQAVKSGETLGLCGNSGNSSEPHLHFHLQDKPKFGEGESMPAQFLNYLADGKSVERGEPTKGQQVRPR